MTGPDPLDVLESRLGARGLAQVLDGLAEAITVRDHDHHILYANRAAVQSMGFSSLEEMLDRPPHAIFGDYEVEDDLGRPVVMDDIPSVRLLAGRTAPPLVLRITHRGTGVTRWVMLKSAPLYAGDGAAVAAATIIEDITRQKNAEVRSRLLARASASLMSSLDYEETLRRVAWLAVPEIADWCAVDLVDDRGELRMVAVAHRDPAKGELAEALVRLRPVDLDPRQGVGRVIHTGVSELHAAVTPEMLATTPYGAEYRALLAEVGMGSILISPLAARGRTLGAVTLVNAESPRRFDETDRAFADEMASRAAVAVENARLATERREIALTLQHSLLPDVIPEIEGWQAAAMYRPGGEGEETEVGGDFYDFIASDEGWIVLLGDVTGKGVQAAAMTAMVRHGARFLGRYQPDPGAILKELNLALRSRGGLSLCTAVCVRLHADHVVISSGGHPPPLVVRDDGRLRQLGVSGDILGAWEGGHWATRRARVGADETLVLYTDGVTELPGRSERYGVRRLRRFLREAAGSSPEEMIASLRPELEGYQGTGPADDTAVLALRPTQVNRAAEVGIEHETPRDLEGHRTERQG